MESSTVPASTPARTGPQDLTSGELGRYGLGVVVRRLRIQGAPLAQLLNRVYCLLCGIGIDHEERAPKWWLCRNECNTQGSF